MRIIDNEEFYEVPRYKDRLLISKSGKMYSLLSDKILKTTIFPNGYAAICVMFQKPKRHTKTEYVHRLLAETFIPNPDNKKTVNHIDGNKLNNSLENLEWNTQSENNIHALRHNLRKPNIEGFTRYNKSKQVLNDKEIKFIKNHKDLTVKEISHLLNNKHLNAIRDCLKGRSFKNYE